MRRGPAGLVWTCPRCDMENPIEATACSRCGTRFDSMFRPAESAPAVDPDRAARLSLLFPGVGHMVGGRVAEGVARAVVFAWTALTALTILVMRGGFQSGPGLPLLLLYLFSAMGIYGVTAFDAARQAEGDAPLLSSRMLLYGVVGLILATVAALLMLTLRAR